MKKVQRENSITPVHMILYVHAIISVKFCSKEHSAVSWLILIFDLNNRKIKTQHAKNLFKLVLFEDSYTYF